MMQPASKVANDTFGNQYRLAAKSMKQAAVAASTTMQKKSLALLFQVGGWDCQNLHDVIVVAFQHEMQNNRNAVEMGGGWDHCS